MRPLRPPTLDPMAGATARAIRTDPAAPRCIGDPTDLRYGEYERSERPGDAQRIYDPTDPEYGELSA